MTEGPTGAVDVPRANVLLVDDREENLLALQAVLAPLEQRLVAVTSGAAALREVLRDDFACMLLDVQMPDIDGFELAALIKRRRRSEHIPIIFVTALSTERGNVFRGYSTGAVDYISKPIDPEVLRSKVSVFVELWQKNRRLRQHEQALHEQELQRIRQASEARYKNLADAMPQIVWTADADGGTTYLNRRWFEYTGLAPADVGTHAWQAPVHPDDLPAAAARREATLRTGETFEAEYRYRARDGGYRWHLGRAVPVRGDDGRIDFWVGTATDIDDRRRAEDQRSFIAAAGDVLSRSLDYRETLGRVAELAAGAFAGWCAVHVVESDGSIAAVAVAHLDPARATFARELEARYPPRPEDATGAAAVIRTGAPELVAEVDEQALERDAVDALHLELLRQLGSRSSLCVPLTGPAGSLGAITLATVEAGRPFGAEELLVAEELARRTATAIDNARLYRQAAERAQAARVLATIGDGVALVDRSGRIRLWNGAAERILGVPEQDALGRRATAAVPGWERIERHVPVTSSGEPARVERVPVESEERELWLSISAVGFEDGTVYAFRDLTEERALETMRQDLVATVSHELRTPLAAIYGAALTLRRRDVQLQAELHDRLLDLLAEEAAKLATIVDDLLLASQLDSGRLAPNVERCDPREIAQLEIDAAQAHLPDGVELVLRAPEALPPVSADPGQLRQVLSNLLDNAVKYSPDGGTITLSVEPSDRHVRFAIADSGLGVPPAEQRRIFEKFYRLDPHMKHGIGGTGLGLYICRELVRRVDGRIWVESDGRSGSTFVVELPRGAPEPARENGGRLRVASG